MHPFAEYYKESYSATTSFERMFGESIFCLNTSNSKHWNEIFYKALQNFLYNKEIIDDPNVDLKYLHEKVDSKYFAFNTVGNQNNSRPMISDVSFDFLNFENNLYLDFLIWIRENVIKQNFYFQKVPTIRFHIPGVQRNLTLPAWHSDSFLGHSPKEINFWFGLTNNDKSDFWVHDLADSKKWFSEFDYDIEEWKRQCFSGNKEFMAKGFIGAKEMRDIYNTIAIFDSRCIHAANHRSDRDYTTKITIDLRVILVKDYEWKLIDEVPVFIGQGIKKAEFKPGGKFGYNLKSIEEIMNEQ